MKLVDDWRRAKENEEGVEVWVGRETETTTIHLWLNPRMWGLGTSVEVGWFQGQYYHGIVFDITIGPFTFMWLRNRP